MKKIDWAAIKTAYITGDDSQRELSARFGVSYSALADRCRREGWVDERKKLNSRAVAQAMQQATRTRARALARIIEASDALDNVIAAFAARLATEGLEAISLNGQPGRELESLSKALLNSDELKRRLNNMLLPRDEERMKLDRQKLELEKKKQAAEEQSDKKIVFELAPEIRELIE